MLKFLKETNKLAILSFLFGIFSSIPLIFSMLKHKEKFLLGFNFNFWLITFCGFVFGFIAIIFGALARFYLKKTKLKYNIFSSIGIILGIFSCLFYFLCFIGGLSSF